MRRPPTVPADGLPDRVTIDEVGSRDGLQNEPLQNEPGIVPVKDTAECVRILADAGLARGAWTARRLGRPSASVVVRAMAGSA